MSEYITSSDVHNNWREMARKEPMGPRELGQIIVLLLLLISALSIARWWQQESFKKNNPAAYQRQVLEKSLSRTNFRGWRIHLSGNDREVEEARKLLMRSGVTYDQFIVAKSGNDSTAFSISLSHDYHEGAENIAIGDIPRHIHPPHRNRRKKYKQAPPKPFIIELPESVNAIGMKFRQIPAGTFMMGEGNDAHEVTLTKPLKIGVHEVTQAQYEQVMGINPSKFKGADNPVQTVSWEDAVEFCRKLSELPAEKEAGNVYRLPTEAEWEHACRAGTTTKYSFGDDESEAGYYAWVFGNSDGKTHPVGNKLPNAWGLYDMHGNVREWCKDRAGNYPSGSVTDPSGATSGSYRVLRGGSWSGTAEVCRSAIRLWNGPSFRYDYYGFRVCLIPSGQPSE